MAIKILFVLTVVFLSWVCSKSRDRDKEDDNPFYGVSVVLADLNGMSCRPGFENITDEITDAVYHCADLLRTRKESHIKFDGRPKVQFDKATPILCMKACTLRESGGMTADGTSVDEIRLRNLLYKGFGRPGGFLSASSIATQFMKCQKRFRPIFPRRYDNCTDTDHFFKCARRTLRSCDNDRLTHCHDC